MFSIHAASFVLCFGDVINLITHLLDTEHYPWCQPVHPICFQ